MSASEKRPHRRATQVAELAVRLLRDGCERVEVAGSIRRGVPLVGDVEIVCVPRHRPDLFGGDGFDMLNETVRLRVRERRLSWRKPKGGLGAPEPDHLDGRRYYALGLEEQDGPWSVDVFCVRPPAQWGAIFAIRTGPADYAKRLVTQARARNLKCEDGRLVSTAPNSLGVELQTPEERDFVAACGLPYVAPEHRR